MFEIFAIVFSFIAVLVAGSFVLSPFFRESGQNTAEQDKREEGNR